MDEIDAIGGKRFSEGTSADREIQRTLMEVCSVPLWLVQSCQKNSREVNCTYVHTNVHVTYTVHMYAQKKCLAIGFTKFTKIGYF